MVFFVFILLPRKVIEAKQRTKDTEYSKSNIYTNGHTALFIHRPQGLFFHHPRRLATTRAILLAQHNELELVIASEYTSACNGTEDVGTCTLEE